MKRKLIWTNSVVADLEKRIEYIKERSPQAAQKIMKKIFSKIKVLIDFPDFGSPIQQYEEAEKKAEYLLALESIPKIDLTLNEIIIDKFTIMYGFNEGVVVILFIKHQPQKDYYL